VVPASLFTELEVNLRKVGVFSQLTPPRPEYFWFPHLLAVEVVHSKLDGHSEAEVV